MSKPIFSLPFLIMCVVLGAPIFAQEQVEVTPLTIGQTIKFDSKVLKEERKLHVFLPLSYKENQKTRYHVIYVLDGSLDEDFIHIAGLTQFGSFPWIKMLPESIVVGIANVDRKRDFTFPSTNPEDKSNFPTAGGSNKFIELLEQEVQPLINKQYRTSGVDTIIGQSLGGLLVSEILFKHSNLFENYVIVSPSLWWSDRALLKMNLPIFERPISVFVGVGKEGKEMESLAMELFEKIDAIEDDGIQRFYKYFPELDHGDTLHLAVYNAFDSIFSADPKK